MILNIGFLILNILLLFYFVKRRSCAPIAYFILFQEIHLIPFRNLGLEIVGYLYYFVLAIVFFFLYNGVRISKGHVIYLLRSKIGLFFILLSSTLVLHTLKGLDSPEALELVQRYFLQVVPALVYLVLCFDAVKKETAIKELSVGILLYGIILALILLSTTDALAITEYKRSEISENIGVSPIAVTRIGCVVLIASIFLLAEASERKYSFFYATGIAGGMFMIMLGTSRGPVLSLVFALFVFLVFSSSGKNLLRWLKKRLFIATVVGFSMFVLFILLESIGVLELFISRFESLENVENMTRFLRYIKALDYFRNDFSFFSVEFLFGSGPAGFSEKFSLQYAHNLILELIFEYGMIGIILIWLLFSGSVKASLRIFRLNVPLTYKVIPVLVLFRLCSSMFSGDLIDWRNLFFLCVMLIIINRKVLVDLQTRQPKRL